MCVCVCVWYLRLNIPADKSGPSKHPTTATRVPQLGTDFIRKASGQQRLPPSAPPHHTGNSTCSFLQITQQVLYDQSQLASKIKGRCQNLEHHQNATICSQVRYQPVLKKSLKSVSKVFSSNPNKPNRQINAMRHMTSWTAVITHVILSIREITSRKCRVKEGNDNNNNKPRIYDSHSSELRL